jgi:hypothetical protein
MINLLKDTLGTLADNGKSKADVLMIIPIRLSGNRHE